jgi:alkanesulfonate monooxygenase SsuD/methylene tetrahydromethanopterin reductase-like flavin-dependent oxidoreductase (luciferase family)
MFLMRFTERAYVNYTAEDVKNSPNSAVRLTFSNRHFDPQLGADLYNTYLDEYEYCEEVGFDGLMLNEHHNTPTCMGATMNLEAAILARTTKKPKIVLLGNPLPIFDNPVRLAEELAEIDMISRGRLVSGFVRGTYAVCSFPNAGEVRPLPEEGPRMTQTTRPGEAATTLTAVTPDDLYEVVDGQVVEKAPMGAYEILLGSRLNTRLDQRLRSIVICCCTCH